MTTVYCDVCETPVSLRRSPRLRLARPDGGYDHAHCGLGMTPEDFRDLDRSANRATAHRTTTRVGWSRVIDVSGGWVVICRLCGKGAKKRFEAKDTNHSEALRLATAYEAMHRMSEMHSLALGAFHAQDAPALREGDLLLSELFGQQPPDEMERRRHAATAAAGRFARTGGKPT